MKNLKLLLLAIPFILFACSDNDISTDPNLLLGEWEQDDEYKEVKVNTNYTVASKTIQEKFNYWKLTYHYFNFNNNGYFSLEKNEYPDANKGYPYEVKGNKLILVEDPLFTFYIEKENTLYLRIELTDNVKPILPYALHRFLVTQSHDLNEEEIKELIYLIENPDKVKVNEVTITYRFKRIKITP